MRTHQRAFCRPPFRQVCGYLAPFIGVAFPVQLIEWLGQAAACNRCFSMEVVPGLKLNVAAGGGGVFGIV